MPVKRKSEDLLVHIPPKGLSLRQLSDGRKRLPQSILWTGAAFLSGSRYGLFAPEAILRARGLFYGKSKKKDDFNMKRWLKNAYFLLALGSIVLPLRASAMHIGEGFLPAGWSIAWGVVCLPFLIYGLVGMKKRIAATPKVKILLAMCGAFAFVLSALKIPSVTGSCSHPTGVGLGAVLFGPGITSVLGFIVLVFQALLLAHGGITTLGANTFSMAIAGPVAAWLVFKGLKKLKVSTPICVFAAACLGDLLTYVVTSIQLGVVYGGFGKFLGVFALTQIPLAIAEGLLTVVIYNILEKYSPQELRELSVL